jgi:hypothetical protein
MKTTCSKSKAQNVNDNNATAPDALASQPWITLDDVTGDIERMIGILVTPYVDDSNPLMHRDELQAECRAKLAAILHAGHLHRCPTRAKSFGFIKTSMKNHIRSLVQKFAFTEKRTGVKPPPRAQREQFSDAGRQAGSLAVLSLDDEEASLQVGSFDPSFRKMEFIEELDQLLTPDEREILSHLVERRWADSCVAASRWSATRLRDSIGSIRAKARGVVGLNQ